MAVRRLLAAVGVATSMALLAACGSSTGKPSSAPTSPSTAIGAVQRQAIPGEPPSASSKMICSAEGQGAIAGSLGVKPSKPIRPTWAHEVYACDYVYPNGTMRLTVHELPTDAAAMQAFNQLKTQLGGLPAETVLGQGTFRAPDDSVYVVKDNKVLKIDVAKMPAAFGGLSRTDVAFTVAVTVMGCWTGV